MNLCDELFKLMSVIKYGYIDKKHNKHTDLSKFFENYILQSPNEMKESKIGICWDQVEYERDYFENKRIDVETYFIVYYNGRNCPAHTFLLFKDNNKYIWVEH